MREHGEKLMSLHLSVESLESARVFSSLLRISDSGRLRTDTFVVACYLRRPVQISMM